MLLNGSEILVQCLREQGVDTIFGYPGGAVLNIYDALFKHRDEIKHYLTSHEQGAAHAADGYARATGKVGVCLATSGPGACNLVTGIATAYMDSVPMVAITGTCTRKLRLLFRPVHAPVPRKFPMYPREVPFCGIWLRQCPKTAGPFLHTPLWS